MSLIDLLMHTVTFLFGFACAEVTRALRRPPLMGNPYLDRGAQGSGDRHHEHTRPPGWHP